MSHPHLAAAAAAADGGTAAFLAKLGGAQAFLLQLDGMTRFQWLEKLLSLEALVAVPEETLRQILAQVRQDDQGERKLELARFALVKLLPDASQHEMAGRLIYAASKAHTARNDSTVQYLHYLDQDVRTALWSDADALLPFFKWLQFNLSSAGLGEGRADDLDLPTAVVHGLAASELKQLGERFAERGALCWFFGLSTAVQAALAHHFVHARGGKF